MIERAYVPDIVSGYQIYKGMFSFVIPEATVNLDTNPSFETGTTGATALSSTIARVTTFQRRGLYSLSVTPTASTESGVYKSFSLTAGQPYAVSLDLYGEAGKKYYLWIGDTSNNRLSLKSTIYGQGAWQRVNLVYSENATNTRRVFLTRDARYGDTNPFYTDGWQVENKDHVTMYVDGDLKGYVINQNDFGWNGAAHASTSFRSALTRAGGKEVKLIDLGLSILTVIGLGMAPVNNIATANSLGGSYYQKTVQTDRTFSIVAQVDATKQPNLQRARADIDDVLNPFLVDQTQPMLLRYTPLDDDGTVCGETLDIQCNYGSGREGSYDSDTGERMTLQFTQFLPLISAEGNKGAELGYQTTVADADYVLKRTSTGTWQALSTGLNGSPRAFAVAADGSVYIGGGFTSAAGVANTAYIAKWNPSTSTFTALGTGMSSDVFALAIGPDGTLYAGGMFLSAGGVANTAYIAKWNGSVWSPLGTGASTYVRALTIGPDGILYAGGDFVTIGGVTVNHIGRWNGTIWDDLDSGLLSGACRALVFGANGHLYAGGDFQQVGSDPTDAYGAAEWDGSSWYAMPGTRVNTSIYALAADPDGSIYAGGVLVTEDFRKVARWNGASWSNLGSGLGGDVYTLLISPDGKLYAGGDFYYTGYPSLVVQLTCGMAVFNGSEWSNVDVYLSTAPIIYALQKDALGNMYIGFEGSGTAVAPTSTSVTIENSSAYPKITIVGPGTISNIENHTIQKTIYLNNIAIMAGETITLDFDPSHPSFVSSFRGDMNKYVLSGSDMNFKFIKGQNAISAFVYTGTTAATAASVTWKENNLSIDGATR